MCLLFSAAKVKHFSEITNKKKDFLRYLLKLVRNNGKNEEKCIIGHKRCHEDIVDGASQLMDVPFMDSPSPLDGSSKRLGRPVQRAWTKGGWHI